MKSGGKIAVAAREIESGRRGMSRWLGELLQAWRAAGRSGDVTLYLERGLPPGFDPGSFEVRATGPGPGGGATAWEQWTLVRALRADRPRVLLCPANSVPVASPVPTVAVVHDLSFEAHPEWFGFREGLRRRLLARAAVRRSPAVIAVSDFTAAEIERLYAVRPPRVRVVQNGVGDQFRPPADSQFLAGVATRFGITGELVLAVGSIFNRRHLPELVSAFAGLRATRPSTRLLVIGDNRTHPRLDIDRLLGLAGVRDHAAWVESVDDDTLIGLYGLARVAVYLSDYEGFGLPPLEALACGAPVVASATSALAENLTGRARLVDEHTPAAIAAAIASVLDAPPPPPRLRPEWLAGLSWTRTAAAVRQILEEVA